MLGKLFGSQARVKLLKLFLMHPEKKYYIRQIARDLRLQLNSVRRELENLEKFGLLTSNPEKIGNYEEAEAQEEYSQYITSSNKSRSGKKEAAAKKTVDSIAKLDKKFYRVNTDFILYEEIKALIVKSQMLYEQDFVQKVLDVGKPKLLILCGFFVNDNSAPVDLFFAGRVNKGKLEKLIKDLEGDLSREINYTVMDMDEFTYRRDITDVFLYHVLEGKKIAIIDELGISDVI